MSCVQARTYLSSDEVIDLEERLAWAAKTLNSFQPKGLPQHKLTLKHGCPIMLIRNLNGSRRQTNGTRCIIEHMHDRYLDVKIMNGTHEGNRLYLPRIGLECSAKGPTSPVALRCRQFPIMPAFGMTINKAQGQTLERVAVYLPTPVFSHGQLYVAFSRVGDPDKLIVMVVDGHRVVFKQVFVV